MRGDQNLTILAHWFIRLSALILFGSLRVSLQGFQRDGNRTAVRALSSVVLHIQTVIPCFIKEAIFRP